MLRYKLLERGDIFREEDVSLVNGVAKIFNPNIGVTTEFTSETFPDHFERFVHFWDRAHNAGNVWDKRGTLQFCYEIGLGVEESIRCGMKGTFD